MFLACLGRRTEPSYFQFVLSLALTENIEAGGRAENSPECTMYLGSGKKEKKMENQNA